jgi:hypothetical protein
MTPRKRLLGPVLLEVGIVVGPCLFPVDSQQLWNTMNTSHDRDPLFCYNLSINILMKYCPELGT